MGQFEELAAEGGDCRFGLDGHVRGEVGKGGEEGEGGMVGEGVMGLGG